MSTNNKILCINMIKNGYCTYGYKCVFAHSLLEQKVDPVREKIYNIIKNKINISKLDLLNDKQLFKNLIEMTKTCSNCNADKCTGGYNCKYGAINKDFTICYDDLMRGLCGNIKCLNLHLTKFGLIPYNVQKKKLDLSSSSYSPNYNYGNKMYEETGNTINKIKDLTFAKKIFMEKKTYELDSDSDENWEKESLSDDDSDEMLFD